MTNILLVKKEKDDECAYGDCDSGVYGDGAVGTYSHQHQLTNKTKSEKFIKFAIFGFISSLLCYWIVSSSIMISSQSGGQITQSTQDDSSIRVNMSRVANIADWSTCLLGDTCASSNWVCCVAPADTAAGKRTCRPGYDASQCTSTGSTGGSTGSTGTTGARVNDWSDCLNPSADTCASPGWVCCVAPADTSSNKFTCRPNQSSQCAVFPSSQPNPSTTPSPPPSGGGGSSTGSGSIVYSTDASCGGSKAFTCPQSTPCCSQYGWCGSTDAYCNAGTTQSQWAYRASGSSPPPSTTSTTPAPPSSGSKIASWSTCPNPTTDSCIDSGYICCVAPADTSSNKFTCRPRNDASQCTSSTTNPPPTTNGAGLVYTPNSLPVTTDATCGSSIQKQCGPNACCGRSNYCGSTPAYCSVGCQSTFGACSPRLPAAPAVGSGSVPVHTTCKFPGMIALTFDDGNYKYTQDLLNKLGNAGVKASFFLNGANYVDITVAPYPTILTNMKNAGHFIGSHTYQHADLATLSTQQIYEQLQQNDNVISSIISIRPTYIRAPYGSLSTLAQNAAASWGYKAFISWNLDTKDFASPTDVESHKQVYRSALSSANPSSDSFIVLQHDVIQSTVEDLIPWVLEYVAGLNQGWKFVTLDECLGVSDQYR